MWWKNMEHENHFLKNSNNLSYTTINKRRFFNISKDYTLTKKEENESINQINQLLKEFDNELDLLPLETTYYSIIPLGRKICQDILKLLLNKEGYFVTEYVIFFEIAKFSKDYQLIPEKQFTNLNEIKKSANRSIHGRQPSNKDVLNFLKSFEEFIEWFNLEYYENDNQIRINDITPKIVFNIERLETKKDIKPKRNNKRLKYSLYNQEELDDINQINKLLNDYEKQLKLISSEKKFYYAFTGSTITELMLKLLLKKEKLYNPNIHYTFFLYIETLRENRVIPKECENFLHLIRRYRNKFIHGAKQSDKLVLSFLKAFNYFIQWFDNYYYLKYQNKFQIEECCELIYSLTFNHNKHMLAQRDEERNFKRYSQLKIYKFQTQEDIITLKNELQHLEQESVKHEIQNAQICSDVNHEDKLNDEIIKLKEELKIKEETYQNQIKELNKKNEDILKKLDEYGKLFGRCIVILEESNEREKRIENKIDDLHSKIDALTNQITIIQSLTERQIKNAQSTEEIERIIETYIDECIDNIMNYSTNFTNNHDYEIEKTKLIYKSIGEEGWNKLCEKSKTFLITSKVMYNHLKDMEDIIDYSGICVLVTKALEVEIHKRFFTNFLGYLNRKYGRNYKKYHTALLYQNKQPLLSEKFTMGNFAFVMCYIENWNDTYNQKINNKLILMEYCKECVFSNYSEDEIEKLLTKYASSIEEIREKYRNPSAHTNEIKQVDAEECFNLVLDIEKLLKQMLDSFDE